MLGSVVIMTGLAQGMLEYQNDSQKIVNASEILSKIQKGEPIRYDGVIIIGNLNLTEVKTISMEREWFETEVLGFDENIRVVDSSIEIKNSVFKDDVSFNNSIFQKLANFENTTFEGYVDLSGAQFKKPAYFRQATFNKSIYCKSAKFNYTSFSKAHFNQDASFTNAKFTQDVNFNNVYFSCDTSFSGEASFNNARFFGDADFENAKFMSDAIFTNVQFNKNANFRHALFQKGAKFDDAEFKDDAFFQDAAFMGLVDSIDFTRIHFNNMYIEWDKIDNKLVYDNEAYLSLIENYKKLGFFKYADDCYDRYRQEYQKNTMSGIESLADNILDLTYGYGTKPINAVISSIILIVFFGFIWWGCIFCSYENNPMKIGKTQQSRIDKLLIAIKFSFSIFFSGTPLVTDQPKRPNLMGLSRYLMIILFIIERGVGLALFFFFLVAIGRTIIR